MTAREIRFEEDADDDLVRGGGPLSQNTILYLANEDARFDLIMAILLRLIFGAAALFSFEELRMFWVSAWATSGSAVGACLSWRRSIRRLDKTYRRGLSSQPYAPA